MSQTFVCYVYPCLCTHTLENVFFVSVSDVPAWLEDFCQSSNIIEGLPVGRTVAMKYRQLLRDRCATLLDMRNHVYSRQAMLLCEMGRGAEAAQRALPFMHATLHEIDVLQVSQSLAFSDIPLSSN